MNRNFHLQFSKQTEDKVKLAKQFIQSKYRTIIQKENEHQVIRQKILDIIKLSPSPPSHKSNAIQQAIKVQEFNMRKARIKSSLQNYELIRTIGKGAFGQVKLARCKKTCQLYAIKKMAKKRLAQKMQVSSVFLQRDCLSRNKSAWLVQLHSAFQDRKHLYIAMQWVPGGDLLRLLIEKDIFTEEQTRFYIGQLILAIEDMHKTNYIHRDIKPDNILIDRNGHLKLTDFGLSKQLEFEQKIKKPKKYNSNKSIVSPQPRKSLRKIKANRQRQFSKVGTPDYIAPQVLTHPSYDHKVDIWSVGVIMFECLFGYPPFSHQDSKEVCNRVINWEQYLSFPDESHVSLQAKILVIGMLSAAQQRLSISQIKSHPFFNGFDWKKVRNMDPPFKPALANDLDTKYFDKFDDPSEKSDQQQIQGDKQNNYEHVHRRRSSSLNYQYTFAGFDWRPSSRQNPLLRTLKQMQDLKTKPQSPNQKSYKQLKTQYSQKNFVTSGDFFKTRGSSRNSLKPRTTIKKQEIGDKLDKTDKSEKLGLLKKVGFRTKQRLKTQAR